MLGIDVAKSTVEKYRPKLRKPPAPTWRTFLKQHMRDTVAIDFFTVPTVRLRVLFVLIVLSHDRRKIVHFNVTVRPTAEWTARQLVEAFPWKSPPKYLLRDRDAIYGKHFRKRVCSLGMKECPIAPRSPWQNPYVERVIGCAAAREALAAGNVWITSSSSTSATSNSFSVAISPMITNGTRTDPWRWIHPMADLSTHPNWARSSSFRQSMACITPTSGKPHEFSGPTAHLQDGRSVSASSAGEWDDITASMASPSPGGQPWAAKLLRRKPAKLVAVAAVTITASTGRTQDWHPPPRQYFKSLLATREPSTQDAFDEFGKSRLVTHLGIRVFIFLLACAKLASAQPLLV